MMMQRFKVIGLAWLIGLAAPCAEAATAVPVHVIPSTINASCILSRTSGVAPLAVFLDCTGTTASSLTSKPFHEISYSTTFGDVGAGTWSNGTTGQTSKNIATGAVAAHIYDTANTYSICPTLTYSNTSVTYGAAGMQPCLTVTVSDPDTVYSGTNTVCIANSQATAGAGGCPSGASTPAGTADFDAALASCLASTKRCLFKKGDTFTASATTNMSTFTGWTIGAYGSGALPVVNSTNVTPITFNSASGSDGRILDLEFVGSGSADAGLCVSFTTNYTNILIKGITCRELGKGIIVSSGSDQVVTGAFIVENTINNYYASGGNSWFGGAARSAFMGNNFGPVPTSGSGEHLLRLQPGQKVAITNNTLFSANTTKSNLTIRARDHTGQMDDTWFVYVSDNAINGATNGANNGFVFQIAPASSTQNDRVYDVVAERNYIQSGTVAAGFTCFSIEASNVTIRNNICNLSGGAAGHVGVTLTHTNTGGVPVPDGNAIYNNTFYTSDASANFYGVLVGSGSEAVSNTTLKNNLGYAPNDSNHKLALIGAAATGTTGASGTFGNSSDVQVGSTSPLFTTNPPTIPSDFKPTCTGSTYPCAGGVSVPVWSDFFLATEPATRDIGAVAH